MDALSHLGVTEVGKPASPERVWRAIQAAKGKEPPGDAGGTHTGSSGRHGVAGARERRRWRMIPAAFEYARADSVDHAIQLLGGDPEAKLLAGGHSLLPLMKVRFAQPSMLVDIGRLSDLSYIREDGDEIAIGALTRHHDVEHSDALHELCPIVSYTAGTIGDPQVRHMGTIGGSVAHADAASDMPTVLLALDASIVAQGPNGVAHDPGGRLLRRACSRARWSRTRC